MRFWALISLFVKLNKKKIVYLDLINNSANIDQKDTIVADSVIQAPYFY